MNAGSISVTRRSVSGGTGSVLASRIRKKRATAYRHQLQWRWHLDEVFVRINGETFYLWRAVVHEGEVLESFVTKKRDRKAALYLLRSRP